MNVFLGNCKFFTLIVFALFSYNGCPMFVTIFLRLHRNGHDPEIVFSLLIRSIRFKILYTDFSFCPLSKITFYVTVGLKSWSSY